MTKCCLGYKKIRKIQKITGYKVASAYVRGGWSHYWAEVWFENLSSIPFDEGPPYVNYITGEIDWNGFDLMSLKREGIKLQ